VNSANTSNESPDCDDITNAAGVNGVTAIELITAELLSPPQLSSDFGLVIDYNFVVRTRAGSRGC